MKSSWLILGIAIGIVATLVVSAWSRQREMLARTGADIAPWTIRALPVEDTVTYDRLGYSTHRFALGLPQGVDQVRIWVEESFSDGSKPTRTVLDFNFAPEHSGSTPIGLILPTADHSTALAEMGEWVIKSKSDAIFDRKAASRSSSRLIVGEDYPVADGMPILLLREAYQLQAGSESASGVTPSTPATHRSIDVFLEMESVRESEVK